MIFIVPTTIGDKPRMAIGSNIVYVPHGWESAIFIHEEDFVAIMLYHNRNAVANRWWVFLADGRLCAWEKLSDEKRYQVRNHPEQGGPIREQWCPGGYEGEEWKTLEVLESL